MNVRFLLVLLFATFFAAAQNTTYYVDALAGNDGNRGTLDAPWKTITKVNNFRFQNGDKVLFAGGQVFGKIELQAHDEGVSLGSFNGVAILGGLYAYNVGTVTVEDLSFKGPGMSGNSVNGIQFYLDSFSNGGRENILIQNVSVYNFGGNGISIGAWLTTNGYTNVKVLNSSVYENGIGGLSTYGYNDYVNHSSLYINNVKAYRNYGRTDITSTNTGSGILVAGFNGGVVEHSEAYENGKYNRSSGGGPQGMWCYNSSNITFQYNVSHHNRAGRLYDGGGFDIDGGSQNCIVQYCFSYENDGAGYAFFEHNSSRQFDNNIIRYNISQNDARASAHGAIMLWAKDTFNRVKNSQIYNNSVYVETSSRASAGYPVGVYLKWSNFKNISYFNNIIYTLDTVKILAGSYSNVTFSNNNYFTPGRTASFKKGGVSVDPLFKNVGGGKDGYILYGNSTMINGGKAAPVSSDIVGTPVPSSGGYDIGAYEANYTAPVANAGADQTITLPTTTVSLDGSGTDADGTIEKYVWSKISGPSQYTITSPNSAATTVNNLIQGTYIFRLTVMDNDSAKNADDVQIVVNAEPVEAGTKVIKVNIYGGTNAYTNTEWNNWNVGTSASSNKSSGTLKYVDGAVSTINAVLSATSGMADNGSTYGGGMAPAEVLRYSSTHSATRTLTINGLSALRSYTIEFYASRNLSTAGNTIFSAGGVSQTISAYANLYDKALFSNLVPNAGGQLVITISKSLNNNYLNGFIITEGADIPPPAGVKYVKTNIYGGTNPYTNTEWNNWSVGTTTATNKSALGLKYSDGSSSAINALISATTGISDNGSTYGGGMAPAEVLRYASVCTTARTLTLSGLSGTNTYNLDLYASRNNTGYSTTFTVGETSVTVVTDKNKTNIASFVNLVPNSSGQIVVSIQNLSTYNYLNGFVLKETSTTNAALQNKTSQAVKPTGEALQALVYPNPSTQQFTLKLSAAALQPVSISIRNAAGQLVESWQSRGGATTLNLGATYKNGIYFAEIRQGSSVTTLKLVKARN